MGEQQEAKLDSLAIFKELRADILSCRLMPGTLIYEQDLGRRFGVSKSPVREALVRLREQALCPDHFRFHRTVSALHSHQLDADGPAAEFRCFGGGARRYRGGDA